MSLCIRIGFVFSSMKLKDDPKNNKKALKNTGILNN